LVGAFLSRLLEGALTPVREQYGINQYQRTKYRADASFLMYNLAIISGSI
jgi:hypothetical protein